ncbi:hypothetical protein [Psychrobacter fozii]|nr:hypothetical protein [Psychrobacter fozii]
MTDTETIDEATVVANSHQSHHSHHSVYRAVTHATAHYLVS